MLLEVLWLHTHCSSTVFVVYMNGATKVNSRMTLADVPAFLEASTPKFIILDGYNEKFGQVLGNVFSFTSHPERKGMVVSSLLKISTSGILMEKFQHIKRMVDD